MKKINLPHSETIEPIKPMLDYTSWLIELKQRIYSAQQHAALSINCELIFAEAWPNLEFVQQANADGGEN